MFNAPYPTLHIHNKNDVDVGNECEEVSVSMWVSYDAEVSKATQYVVKAVNFTHTTGDI